MRESLHRHLVPVSLVLGILVLAPVHGAELQEPESSFGAVTAEAGCAMLLGHDHGRAVLLGRLGEGIGCQGGGVLFLLRPRVRIRCVWGQGQECRGPAFAVGSELLGLLAQLGNLIGGGGRHLLFREDRDRADGPLILFLDGL